MRSYPAIDIAKFIMSFLVIVIHTNAYNVVPGKVCNLAVPLFFVFSGFFMYKGYVKGGIEKVDNYLIKLVRMYVMYTVLYLPLTVYGYYINGKGLGEVSLSFVRNFLFVGEFYYSWPLWYLLALVVATGIIRIMLKKKVGITAIFATGVLMALAGYGLDYLHENATDGWMKRIVDVYFDVFTRTRNGFFIGLGYVTTGMLLAHCEEFICKYRYFVAPAAVITGAVYGCDVFFSINVFVPVMACVIVALCGNMQHSRYGIWFRNISTMVYFFHMYIVFALENTLFYGIGVQERRTMLFVCTAVISVSAAWAVVWMSKKEGMYFLKKLYS